MKRLSIYLALAIATVLTSCGNHKKLIVPLSKELYSIHDNYPIVWVGSGISYIYLDGEYVRSESNDYSFEVVQRRYGNTWKSIKNMHRIHPDYDGKAGEREQTMFFEIKFSQQDNQIVSKITSSLGSGTGLSDNEFREQSMQFSAEGVSSFAPYNHYRITQDYQYEEGMLLETVELIKLKDGIETPFAKIQEKAYIFRPSKLDGAPTKFE
jgi:hypothetical protein